MTKKLRVGPNPSGLCMCGCGQKTTLATNNQRDNVKGQPTQYVTGHSTRTTFHKLACVNSSGLCMCGCGQPAPIAKHTRAKVGEIKGQPMRYVLGHSHIITTGMKGTNPSGMCMCGCGQPAPIAEVTQLCLGHIKGKPIKFIAGHANGNPVNTATHFDNGDTSILLECRDGSTHLCWLRTKDYPIIKDFRWRVKKTPTNMYAQTNVNGVSTMLHVMLVHSTYEVDHIDTDGLNNRRTNLRPATGQQNMANVGKREVGEYTSMFKGVCRNSKNTKWRSTITQNYKQTCLGEFDKEIDAAKAYNVAAVSMFGQFANLNNVEAGRNV
jgi:hypothetical protein